MTVGFELKDFFFDRERVKRAMDHASHGALYRAGARIRRRGISIQKDKKPGVYSPPGSPPYSHVGFFRKRENRRRKKAGLGPLKGGFKGLKHILYGFDETTKSLVIGPVGIGDASVPPLMEFGGGKRIYDPSKGMHRFTTYAPRPFMGPALAHETPRLPELWRGSVKGG